MYIPMWHMWSSNLFYIFDRWSANGWKFGWIRCETLGMYWRIYSWCLRDIHAQICDMNLSAWIGLDHFALQSTRYLRLQRKATKMSPFAALRPHTSPQWDSFTLKNSSDVNVSMCHTSTDSSESCFWFQVGSTLWRYNVKNQSIHHAESHLDTFERFHDIAENIRKWEGAIATCSDTLTAGFHLTVNQRQNRSNLALVKLDCWHCHRQIYHHRLSPLPCISRVRNRFAGQKRLFLTFNWQKGQKQHAGNRFWDSVWANDRCVLGELVIMISDCAEIRKRRVFRVLMVLLVASYCLHVHTHELIAVSKSNFGMFEMFCFGWRSLIQYTLISLNSRDISRATQCDFSVLQKHHFHSECCFDFILCRNVWAQATIDAGNQARATKRHG